ncbi:unnamed protein product, partial [Prorocentrum cordatum]
SGWPSPLPALHAGRRRRGRGGAPQGSARARKGPAPGARGGPPGAPAGGPTRSRGGAPGERFCCFSLHEGSYLGKMLVPREDTGAMPSNTKQRQGTPSNAKQCQALRPCNRKLPPDWGRARFVCSATCRSDPGHSDYVQPRFAIAAMTSTDQPHPPPGDVMICVLTSERALVIPRHLRTAAARNGTPAVAEEKNKNAIQRERWPPGRRRARARIRGEGGDKSQQQQQKKKKKLHKL